jgi:enamine deaminase RidA (YjgF/YER057c/UK114 family)
VLAEFRLRVAGAGLEQAALDALLARLAAEGLVQAGGKQRTDSTHVVAAVAALTVPELGLVYTSGQVAWDKDGNLVGKGDYAKQAEQIVRNLDIALASAGATRDDLIKQTIFVVDYRPEIVPLIMGPLHTGRDGAQRARSPASRPSSPPATSSRSTPWPASPSRESGGPRRRAGLSLPG